MGFILTYIVSSTIKLGVSVERVALVPVKACSSLYRKTTIAFNKTNTVAKQELAQQSWMRNDAEEFPEIREKDRCR